MTGSDGAGCITKAQRKRSLERFDRLLLHAQGIHFEFIDDEAVDFSTFKNEPAYCQTPDSACAYRDSTHRQSTGAYECQRSQRERQQEAYWLCVVSNLE
jgi:hypothetical protein